MALKLLNTIAPCFGYTPGGTGAYNPWLTTAPRIYGESISSVKQFFYAPFEDVYVTTLILSCRAWPGWKVYLVAWNASDGSRNDQYSDLSGVPPGGIFFSHWTNQISVGGYSKFYSTGNSYQDVREVDWQAGSWPGWKCFDWSGRTPSAFSFAVVNRIDRIVAGVGASPLIYVYHYMTHELLGKVAIRDTGYSMTYESDKHLWMTHKTGELAKVNYQTLRHEMMSKVKDPVPSEDLTYRCAFDTRRKILAILRHKKDDTDGACRLQLEFYSPFPQPNVLTNPVPVNSLQAGDRITFVAHVLGDGGEGVASQPVSADLASPATGRLDATMFWSGLNGAVEVGYRSTTDALDTLVLTTEV